MTALLSAVGGSYIGGKFNSPNIAPAGYQGSIPEYTASRTPLALDDTDRRPGSGGRRYMSDVRYTPKDSAPAAPTVNRGQVPTQAPAGGFVSKLTGGLPSEVSNAQVQQLMALIQQMQGGAPSSNPTTPNREAPDATDPMVRSQQFIDKNNNRIDDRDESPSLFAGGGTSFDEFAGRVTFPSKAAPVKAKADPVKLSAVQQNMLRQVQNMAKESGQNPAEVQRLTNIYGDMNAAKKPPVKTKAAPVKAKAKAPVKAKAAPVKAAPKKPLARLPAKAPAPARQTAVETLRRRENARRMFAQGGIANLGQGRYLSGQSDGMADAVSANIDGAQPAALSHGEYVIPADVVGHLGNGNSNAGAKALDDFLSSIRKQRTGNPKQGKQINAQKTLPEVPRGNN